MKKLLFTLFVAILCSGTALSQEKVYDDSQTTYNASGHGSHYSIDAFNVEVEKAYKEWLASEEADGTTLSESNRHSGKTNIANSIYKRYNPNAPEAMFIKFSQNYIGALKGYVTDAQMEAAIDPNDPLLKPISGISFYDYATITAKSQSGDFNKLLAAFKIDMKTWQTVNMSWAKRMQSDKSFRMMKLYAKYMGEADNNPKLTAFKPAVSPLTAQSLKRLDEDYFFAVELSTAASVASQHDRDANAFLKETYGVTLPEVMAKYSKHQKDRVIDSENQKKLDAAMMEYQAKYEAMFN